MDTDIDKEHNKAAATTTRTTIIVDLHVNSAIRSRIIIVINHRHQLSLR